MEFRSRAHGTLGCVRCGLILSPTIWDADAVVALEEQYFGEHAAPAASQWVVLFEAHNNRRTLRRLARFQAPGRRLLEIGVGSGSFLNAARAAGYQVTGCDLSPTVCDRARASFHVRVHCGPIADLIRNGPNFDIVVMNHVLEHVEDPLAFLHDVRAALVPSGIVHVAVPNIVCWEAKLPAWASYAPYHIAYFSPSTLRRALVQGGFSVEYEATHESFSGWPLTGLRTLLNVFRPVDVRQPATVPSSGLARPKWLEHAYRATSVCAGTALLPVRLVQGKLGFGDEAICVARSR